jgi:mRNA interferase HicA
LKFGQKCPIIELLKGSEFVRKVQGLGKAKGLAVDFKAERGKGSHGTLYFGDKRTTVRNLRDELKTGTLHAMLKQLGIKESDLR